MPAVATTITLHCPDRRSIGSHDSPITIQEEATRSPGDQLADTGDAVQVVPLADSCAATALVIASPAVLPIVCPPASLVSGRPPSSTPRIV